MGESMDINTIFKPKSKIGKMILSILGILLISLSIFLFNCAINKPLSDFGNLFKILISSVLGCVGMILVLASFNSLVKSFVTGITLLVYSLFWLIIAAALLIKIPSYYYAITYSCITLCLITYLYFGTKMNNFFIRKMGWREKSESYNYEDLKQNLTVIYITIFVLLNVSTALYNDKLDFYNLINNSFITVITITQIDWSKIFNFR